jgi:hypothetical protein
MLGGHARRHPNWITDSEKNTLLNKETAKKYYTLLCPTVCNHSDTMTD